MRNLGIVVLFLVTSVFCSDEDNGPAWSYLAGHGSPDEWSGLYSTCSGKTQSPINIDRNDAQYDGSLQEIDLIVIEDKDTEMTMQNNGHTVAMHPGEQIHISGLDSVYEVFGPHFHWGNTSMRGSEHVFDGTEAYPLEMHFVTYNKEKYDDITQAITSGDHSALAVFGVLFKASPNNNTVLDPIISNLKNVIEPDNSEVEIKGLKLGSLWPKETTNYYRYTGSLTTPTCNEVVLWTLFEEKTPISEYQLRQFRTVLDTEGLPLVNNFRPVQPLNSRRVTKSFRSQVQPAYDIVPAAGDGVSQISASAALLLSAFMLIRNILY